MQRLLPVCFWSCALGLHPPRRVGSALQAASADDLLAEAAALRSEVDALEREMAPSVATAAPVPTAASIGERCGVRENELVPWDGESFSTRIELVQFDGTSRVTPAEWTPWYEPETRRQQRSVVFTRRMKLPLGLILEEGGGGSTVVVEVVPGGSGADADVRVGDVLRACSSISTEILYGNVMFPLDGANTEHRRVLKPCDMQPFEAVMAAVRSNLDVPEGSDEAPWALLVLERALQPGSRRGGAN